MPLRHLPALSEEGLLLFCTCPTSALHLFLRVFVFVLTLPLLYLQSILLPQFSISIKYSNSSLKKKKVPLNKDFLSSYSPIYRPFKDKFLEWMFHTPSICACSSPSQLTALADSLLCLLCHSTFAWVSVSILMALVIICFRISKVSPDLFVSFLTYLSAY